jgi:twitching motility protein PilT
MAESPRRILYVEDDPDVAAAARVMLGPEGVRLEIAPSAADARAAFERERPDLCLLDLTLPDASGLDLLSEFRRAWPEVPVVIVSGSTGVPDVVAAMKLGAADYLPKPLDPRRFVERVRNALLLPEQQEQIERLRGQTGEGRGRPGIDEILRELVLKGGSDLHLKAGRPPMMRIAGDLTPADFPSLDGDDLQAYLLAVLGREGLRKLQEDFEIDASYELSDLARFRLNAFKRMGQFGAAFRVIPLRTPTLDMMELPPVLKDIVKAPQGLVLVTGPTGSGKSTTLAAMIDQLNRTEPLHIVTVEDPVEFVYTDAKCTITQRQLGSDVKSLKEALRRALRQDPDVILMGEMRDAETIEMAMHAAETGHLVFSTLHTNDAKQTLDRIVDAFPADAAHQVRSTLALTLHAVISQRLLRRADGKGRVAAVEVMINSPNIRELVAEGKTSQIEKAIAGSGDYYRMQTFNQAIARLVLGKTVSEEEGMGASATPGDLRLLLKGIVGGGSSTSLRPAASPPAPSTPAPTSPTTLKINRGY